VRYNCFVIPGRLRDALQAAGGFVESVNQIIKLGANGRIAGSLVSLHGDLIDCKQRT